MKRIAILGCENSHADAFLKFIRENEEFCDVDVVGIYSNEIETAEKLNAKYGVPIMENYADAVGKIDGLIITARHGDNHYKYAKPYIDSAIPMFIDKPITIDENEAVEFMRVLKNKNIRISGGSSLKQDEFVQRLKQEALSDVGGRTVGGYVRAPLQPDSVYGGFYFYAQHLVEMVCEIFGRFPLTVEAKENCGNTHVIFHYEKYDCVGLFCSGSSVYYVSRMAQKSSEGFEVKGNNDWYYKEFKEFYGLLLGDMQTVSYKEFIAPVFIMNAIERSLQSGKEEAIEYKE